MAAGFIKLRLSYHCAFSNLLCGLICLKVAVTLIYLFHLCRLISEVEGELQVVKEVVSKLWVHVDHLQQILSLDGAQITVTQGSNVSVGLPRLGVQVDHLAEDVVLS